MVDISTMRKVIDAVNVALNSGNAAEVRLERNGNEVVVVIPERRVVLKEPTEKGVRKAASKSV